MAPRAPPQRYLNFSGEEDSNLIDLVQQYRPLYDIHEKDHKDLILRNNLWVDIAAKMGRNVCDCKKRWRSMKDTYYRQKRNKIKSNWVLMKRLQFLDCSGRTYEGPPFATTDQEFGYVPNDEDVPVADDSTVSKSNHSATALNNLKVEHYVDELLPYDPDVDSASDWKAKASPIQTEDVIKLIHRNNREKLLEDIETDPIHAFFHSMALSVKKMPPEMIAEARVKICEIVGQLEVKAYRKAEQDRLQSIVKVEDLEEEGFDPSII